MTIQIDLDRVTSVLLIDGWHSVRPGTFELDAYQWVKDRYVRLSSGETGRFKHGFSFIEPDGVVRMAGPLSSILAVRYVPPELTTPTLS